MDVSIQQGDVIGSIESVKYGYDTFEAGAEYCSVTIFAVNQSLVHL